MAAAVFDAFTRTGLVFGLPVIYRDGSVQATLLGEPTVLQSVIDSFPKTVTVQVREGASSTARSHDPRSATDSVRPSRLASSSGIATCPGERPTVVAANLAATVLAAIGFYALMQWFERSTAPYDRFLALRIQTWLGLLIATGLFVFANNLIDVHGQSLLTFG